MTNGERRYLKGDLDRKRTAMVFLLGWLGTGVSKAFGYPFMLDNKQYLTDCRAMIELNTPLDLPESPDVDVLEEYTRFSNNGLPKGVVKYFSEPPSQLDPLSLAEALHMAINAAYNNELSGIREGCFYDSVVLIAVFVILGSEGLELCDTGEYLYIRSPLGQAVLAPIDNRDEGERLIGEQEVERE